MMSNNKPNSQNRNIAQNRRAWHEHTVLETFEAGIVLTGTEIKSIRLGKVSLAESFCRIEKGELFLYGSQIAPYSQGNIHNHAQDRVRKLLIQKKELNRLLGKVKEQGLTLIPLKMYFVRAWVKVEVGLCKGKKLHDKRESIKAKEGKRDIDRAMKGR